MPRTSRVKKFWPIAAGVSATAVVTETTTLFSDTNIEVGDFASITPANVAAATLSGSTAGIRDAPFPTVTAGVVTITHPAAAGGEIWNVVVIPANMVD